MRPDACARLRIASRSRPERRGFDSERRRHRGAAPISWSRERSAATVADPLPAGGHDGRQIDESQAQCAPREEPCLVPLQPVERQFRRTPRPGQRLSLRVVCGQCVIGVLRLAPGPHLRRRTIASRRGAPYCRQPRATLDLQGRAQSRGVPVPSHRTRYGRSPERARAPPIHPNRERQSPPLVQRCKRRARRLFRERGCGRDAARAAAASAPTDPEAAQFDCRT